MERSGGSRHRLLDCSTGDGLKSQPAHRPSALFQDWISLESQNKIHIPFRRKTRLNPIFHTFFHLKHKFIELFQAGQKTPEPTQCPGRARSRQDSSSARKTCASSVHTCISLPLH